MRVYIYICVYMCVCVCIHTNSDKTEGTRHVNEHLWVRVWVALWAGKPVYTYVRVCVCVSVCVWLSLCVHVYTYIPVLHAITTIPQLRVWCVCVFVCVCVRARACLYLCRVLERKSEQICMYVRGTDIYICTSSPGRYAYHTTPLSWSGSRNRFLGCSLRGFCRFYAPGLV